MPACKRTPSLVLIVPTIEFANDSTVLHEGRGPHLKVSDFILQCRTHSVIDVESSSNSKIRSVRGHESRGDSSVLPACRLRVFRPLSYFSPKSENIGNLDRIPFPLSIQPLTALAILGYAKPDFAEAEGSNTEIGEMHASWKGRWERQKISHGTRTA